LREAHRTLCRRGVRPDGVRVALVARAATGRATYSEVLESLARAYASAGLLQPESTPESCAG
jgi:hypothetical protein